MVDKVPGLFDSVPIVQPSTGTPSPVFHRWWRAIADKVDTLVANQSSVLALDGGDATSTGTAGITIEGGTA